MTVCSYDPKQLTSIVLGYEPRDFDPTAYPVYTIERVLEYGDEDAVAWLRRTFAQEQILDVLRTDRHLTRLSANFWALFFGIPSGEVAALASRR